MIRSLFNPHIFYSNFHIRMPELAKSYSPADIEAGLYQRWESSDLFSATEHTDKEPYSILMPPPNVTGILHFGHVLNHTIQDIYIRRARMNGKESCWFPGLDHAGIATQTKVEQQLRKEKITRYDLGREQFLEKVWAWKNEYGDTILRQLRSLGNSSDWKRTLFTLDDSASNAVQEVFIRLFDEGLIYRGKRIINWSPVAQSALSDEEVQFKEVKESIYTLRYHSEDGMFTINVATARPETLFGDVAVAVNPNDERYKDMIGKYVCVPLAGQRVPIIADEYADPAFGTGAVKITPAHDPNDFMVGERHHLAMPNTINPDATLNELTGKYAGVDRFVARKQIVAELESLDLIEKIEDYTHNVGFSERGGEPVEPYLSDQWFVRMKPLAEPAMRAVQDGTVKFYPDHWVKTYEHWMTNIRDWCISRQLWWGHRIPVYYAEDGRFTAARNEQEARMKLGLPESATLRQDDDVLDTWFSSALWPLTTMHWLADGTTEDNVTMQKFLPTNLLVTGPDIIFFWVARMLMMTLKFKQQIPFRDVYFTSIIRDAKGRKLSKSLGNSPDPLDLIAKYGADAVRYTMVSVSPIGQDIRLAINDKTQDIETMEIGRNFANKIWNAARFLLMKKEEAYGDMDVMQRALTTTVLQPDGFALSDMWITSRFHTVVRDAQRALDAYKLNEYSRLLYSFIWGDFCDWYVECIKIRMNTSSDASYKRALVNYALGMFDGVLRLLHPLMPFVTEELWQAIASREAGSSISIQSMPESSSAQIQPSVEEEFIFVQSVIEEIRALRGLFNIAPALKLPVAVNCSDERTQHLIDSQSTIIAAMTRATTLTVAIGQSKPEGSAITVMAGTEIYVQVKDVIDAAKERERLEKEAERLLKMAQSTEAKLSNEKFVAGAPTDVVQYEREKLASFKNNHAKIIANIKLLV